MRKISLACMVFTLICANVFSQASIRDARKKSWRCLVYRISADTAEKYITTDSIYTDQYLQQIPIATWSADTLLHEELPVGNYIILFTKGTELVAEYYCRSDLRVFPLNNQHRVQLEVKNDEGNSIAGTKLWVNRKEITYNEAIKGFQLTQKKADEAIVKVAADGDTLFMKLDALEQVNRNGWQQWWTNITYTKAGRIVTWPVRKVRRMIQTPARNWFRKKYRSYSSRNGYMVFNKPKYLPGDTVKFKAYILTKKGKQYRRSLDMYLDYTYNGRSVTKNMGVVKPATPGSFLFEFVLGDTLESDRSYAVRFVNRKDRNVMRGDFRIEDYLLDEVASYDIRSEKKTYYRYDTLVFYTNAKDANGLALMDGKVDLYLLSKHIRSFYKDREFIPDTLWKGQKILSADGDTKFEIPAKNFPNADLQLNAVAEFRNSNNEIQEKNTTVDFVAESRVIQVRQEAGYIIAIYRENGVEMQKDGLLSYDDEDKERKISFPYHRKIDPFVKEYFFWFYDEKGKIVVSELFEADKYYALEFSRVQQKDTAGFYLHNPNRIPVHYTLFNGKKIVHTATDTAEWISWKKVLPEKHIYNLEWNYIWNQEEMKGRNSIAVLDKLLETKINGANTIYPGQTDTISVSVRDYKGRPAANVNLTAVSYNGQFRESIRVPEPPYLQKFKSKRRILTDNYEITDAGFTKDMVLGKHQSWRSLFGLDTMMYYRLLFPKDAYAISSSVISDFAPQVAVHVVDKGVPQEIYMLYINREFAWYNGVTDKGRYAFSVVPGYTQLAFRLRNKYVEIDSIYLQPFYKHDISFDLDHLPAKAKVVVMDMYYTPAERNRIETQIWQVQDDPRTNNGYVWQWNRLTQIGSPANRYSFENEFYYNGHLVGPFSLRDSLQFFKPADFDLKFAFEPGYQYKLTPKMARLERKSIFYPSIKKIMLPAVHKTKWILGDTVLALPEISYKEKPVIPPLLYNNDNVYKYASIPGSGTIKIQMPADSNFIYGILYSKRTDTTIARIRNYQLENWKDVLPGRYEIILVTAHYTFLSAGDLDIKKDGTYCLKFSKPVYQSTHPIVDEITRQQEQVNEETKRKYFGGEKENWKKTVDRPGLRMPAGTSNIMGIVSDKKGKGPIPGATVYFKGYATAAITSNDGTFSFNSIRQGNYVLIFSSVGYVNQEIRVNILEGETATVNGELNMSENHLSEVVVIGYGTTRKQSLTGSISSIRGEELTTALQGRVAGINVTANNTHPVLGNIVIRGASSLIGNSKPLYVINGIVMDELPEGFVMEGAQVNILKDAAATSIYGSKAANGVIIITTPDFMPKEIRDKFRDYAFWQPNLFTDKNGEAKFAVTYPDNITGWQTFVVGMDKKRRLTKSTTFVKSFKPLLAQLSTPQFLIEGDSSSFIGKVINYTSSDISLTARFKINNILSDSHDKSAKANGSITDKLQAIARKADTLSAQYSVTTASGYSDGELRKIPVFRRGTEEVIGKFWALDKDTSFSFAPDKNAGQIKLYVQNNALDVLLDEIKHLKDYPYYCMEQIASKLTGLLMEKQIRQALKQPFGGEKEIQQLISKLQKTQLFNGGWSWWEGGEASLSITNYVTRALLPVGNDVLVQASIRNAILYLQNRLPQLNDQELLHVLFTLSEAGHEMDYLQYLNKLEFDSLKAHQQWEAISIRQQQKLTYRNELEKVIAKKTETMLGGLHWGTDSYFWESNMMATTALAFKVLGREKEYSSYLKQMIQFFLERRGNGRWRNTVESAGTVAAILPEMLRINAEFHSPASLEISAKETIRIDSFPYAGRLDDISLPFNIKRSGGGLLYFSIWQTIFNPQPEPVNDKFLIETWFEKKGALVTSLVAGEKVMLKIRINVLKDADYVQVEIPIPAGCTYGEKKQQSWQMHREFLKNKVVMFVEKMGKGTYNYEIELEPRYSGSYHLNPAKAELMYFPVFYGRNEMKRTIVE